MKEIDYVEMGKRIKFQRLQLKITQEKLAEEVDVVPSYISEIERGSSISSLAVIVKIADILHMNLDYLICGINILNSESTFKEIIKTIPEENRDLFMDLCLSNAKILCNERKNK